MIKNINNSIINIGTKINGSVTNTVTNQDTYSELIKEIDLLVIKNTNIFNQREIEHFKVAREQLHTGDVTSAKTTLSYFKSAISDILKLTISSTLANFITNI